MRYFSTSLGTEYNRNGIIVQVQNYDCINSEQKEQSNPDQMHFCHPLKKKQTNKQTNKDGKKLKPHINIITHSKLIELDDYCFEVILFYRLSVQAL